MKRLTKNGVPLTPSRRAPRAPRPPRIALSDLVIDMATKARGTRLEPRSSMGPDFTYPWPLAHAGSPTLMTWVKRRP